MTGCIRHLNHFKAVMTWNDPGKSSLCAAKIQQAALQSVALAHISHVLLVVVVLSLQFKQELSNDSFVCVTNSETRLPKFPRLKLELFSARFVWPRVQKCKFTIKAPRLWSLSHSAGTNNRWQAPTSLYVCCSFIQFLRLPFNLIVTLFHSTLRQFKSDLSGVLRMETLLLFRRKTV